MRTQCLVVGGGPAGVATAIQLKRYSVKCVLAEKNQIGGLIYNANLVENYLGFPAGIKGPALAILIEKHIHQLNIDVVNDEVMDIEYKKNTFYTRCGKITIQSDFLVLATGTKAKTSAFPGIEKIPQNMIHTDLSTLYKSKDKTIAIIGAGDAAFDYAINLSYENQVIIYNRSSEHRALPLLWERIKENKTITYQCDVLIDDLSLMNRQILLSLNNGSQNSVDYLLFAIGRNPELSLVNKALQGQLNELEKEGKFTMIGDVVNGDFRQVSIAAGDGIKAAMSIYRKLDSK